MSFDISRFIKNGALSVTSTCVQYNLLMIVVVVGVLVRSTEQN